MRRDSNTWYINTLYVRHDFEECLRIIEETLSESKGLNQYRIDSSIWRISLLTGMLYITKPLFISNKGTYKVLFSSSRRQRV